MNGDRTLELSWPRQHVALATLIRPEARNSITLGMIDELAQVLAGLRERPPAALIVTGSGSAFCAGADLKLLASPEAGLFDSPAALRDRFLMPLAELLDSFEAQPYPIIAAVNGHAMGGGFELALSADLRIAANSATFGLPEVQLGAIPGAGGVQKLIRHVGRAKALEWILLGSRVTAADALAQGLLLEVVEPHALLSRAIDWAERLAAGGPQALATAKAAIYACEDVDLPSARHIGIDALTSLAGTEEWREGVRAFAEKRAPRWRRR